METFTTCLDWNGDINKLFGMNWIRSQLILNDVETFMTCFWMKCKYSQLVSNEMETFTTYFDWSENIHN